MEYLIHYSINNDLIVLWNIFFYHACKHNNFNIIKLIDSYIIIGDYFSKNGLVIACEKKYYNIIKFIFDKCIYEFIDETLLLDLVSIAIKYGHIEIFKIFSPHITNFYNLIPELCHYGKFIKHILDNYELDIHKNSEELFREVCNYNMISLANYMLKKYNNIDTSTYGCQIFRNACQKGNVDIVQLVINDINFKKHNSQIYTGFLKACKENRFEILKIIKTKFPELDIYYKSGLFIDTATDIRIINWLRNDCKTFTHKSARK